MELKEKRIFHILFALVGLVVFAGMFIPVMEVDAAQYASISKQMWREQSFLQVYHREASYLDKPPLLFWLSGLSMGVFGYSHFFYKLPSVLFSVLGMWSTFRLAKLFYDERTAYWATLMYSTSVAFFIFNNDIRTDTLLINLLIFTVYQLMRFKSNGRWLNLVAAFVGVGLAMLAKGPLGLVFPVLAVMPDAFFKKEWKFIFNWKWIPGLFIVAVILLPMSYGLYTQFDARPDAWVNGQKGGSGLRFFYWTQSFGRITGESVWAQGSGNNPGPFYLTQSFLWAFLPWSPLFLFGFLSKLGRLFRSGFKSIKSEEWVSFFAFLLPLIALSNSGYQLNHYIYVVMPFAAIMAAKTLQDWEGEQGAWRKAWRIYIVVFLLAALALICWLCLFGFPSSSSWIYLLIALVPVVFYKRLYTRPSYFLASVSIAAFTMMNLHFYPQLMHYQTSEEAIEAYKPYNTEENKLFFYKTGTNHAIDFEHDTWLPRFIPWQEKIYGYNKKPYLYTNKVGLKILKEDGFEVELLDSFDYFPITQLNAKFLNPSKRHTMTRKRYLVRFAGEPANEASERFKDTRKLLE